MSSTPNCLSITRLIDAPPEKVYQAWIDPAMIKEWFCPRPWRVTEAVVDARPGGASNMIFS